MIELYFWTTPNGYKPLLFLEETGIAHRIAPLDISKGAQFEPEFLAISPNAKIPAIVDYDPAGGGAPLALFESGAILEYLADKTGEFLPAEARGRAEALVWLHWQIGGLGPMLGQNLHFSAYAPKRLPYAVERYQRESQRLYSVLDRRLADRAFVAGEAYTIADMAIFPWIARMEREGPRLERFAEVKRWHDAVAARPATISAYARGAAINTTPTVTEDSKAILLNRAA